MKIVYLHQYFVTPDMPGGTRSYEMGRRLVEAGHEVHMITSDQSGRIGASEGWRFTEEAGIHVHWTTVPYGNEMPYGERIKAFFLFAWRSAREAARVGGDLVFATSTPLTIALPAVYAAKRCGIPMVFEVRDLWPAVPIALGALKNPLSRRLARRLERFAYGNASHVVALAPGMRDAIVETGYPSERVSVIPNGADLDLFDVPPEEGNRLRRLHPWLQGRPLVLFAGTLGMANGVDYLVRLASTVRTLDPEIRFLVIGGGKEVERVRGMAREQGVLESNFFMMNAIPKREIPAWLSASDLVTALFTGPKIVWKDAVQNKFFDAMAAGRPIVNNFEGWQSRIAEEHGAGLILPAEDIPEAARLLTGAIRNQEWMEKARTAARQLGRERFSRERLAWELEQVLTSVRNQYKAGKTF